ncbi:hypothetical protein Shyhy01_20510 [Streptomyces hygroscopicus subsp. hygroscopicus]|nr:SsgA family sporulation/cell division regulator [Streptomyces hygroscopicus]GLX49101.1 hypothetical protein Shyhy01_20510 [Streptomyces hygroscopicus subsp. hygroscopicus]
MTDGKEAGAASIMKRWNEVVRGDPVPRSGKRADETAGNSEVPPLTLVVGKRVDGMRKAHLTSAATYWVAKRFPVAIWCEFSYDVRDPYAVTLILNSEGEHPVRWVFSRELLADGLTNGAGEGDVAVWPENDGADGWFLWVEVGRAPHTARFELPAETVAEWLLQTYRLVPEGQEAEWVTWDELTHLIE